MSKNRKTFVYVLQFGKKVTARIYRVMRNQPVFLGSTTYRCRHHKKRVQSFLVKAGHVSQFHKPGKDFCLESV